MKLETLLNMGLTCEQSFDFYGNAVEFNKIKGGIIESDTYYEHMTATPAQHTETKTLLLIFLLGILYFCLFLLKFPLSPKDLGLPIS